MKIRTRIFVILLLARVSMLLKTSLVAAGLLLAADLFIDVPGSVYTTVIMSACILALLLARDDRLLYECDKVAGSGGLLLTLYYVKEGLFIGRLAGAFRHMGVARFLRFNIAGHVMILALLILANQVTGEAPTGAGETEDLASPAARLESEVARLEKLASSVRSPGLRKRLAALVQDSKKFLAGEAEKLDGTALHGAVLRLLLADKLTAGAAVREGLLSCVGRIAGLVKGDRLRYELRIAREVKAMARQKDIVTHNAIHFTGDGAASSRLAGGDPDFRVAEKIPLKYKLAIKRYFEGSAE